LMLIVPTASSRATSFDVLLIGLTALCLIAGLKPTKGYFLSNLLYRKVRSSQQDVSRGCSRTLAYFSLSFATFCSLLMVPAYLFSRNPDITYTLSGNNIIVQPTTALVPAATTRPTLPPATIQ